MERARCIAKGARRVRWRGPRNPNGETRHGTEVITFTLIAQTEGVSAAELAEELELPDAGVLRSWLGRLLTCGLVEQSGRTSATRDFMPPPIILREAGLDALTTLTRVQPHRLRGLIIEDLERFPDSLSKDIHRRVGPDIPDRTFRRALEALVQTGQVQVTGERLRSSRTPQDHRHAAV